MGERYTVHGFHDVDHEELLMAFEVATDQTGGRFHRDMEPRPNWERVLSRAQGRNVAMSIGYVDEEVDYLLSKDVGTTLSCVWIVVRVQDGTL